MANRIHPTAIIGAGVEFGDGNVVGPYAVIVGPARIGDGNWIGPHVSIGTPAEVRGGPHPAGWEGEADGHGVVIGDRNVLREFVTINQGTREQTVLGNDGYLMAQSHLGHDCRVGDGVTLASVVQLAGHTQVWSWSNLGMGTVVHQFTRIGPGAMIGMGSAVRKDVPPFSIAVGNPARATGVNAVGLSRRGCSEPVIEEFGKHLAGKAELPDGLPPELGDELKAWFQQLADGKM
jgi:UDP-N-acetylglucosamine acyltransferase